MLRIIKFIYIECFIKTMGERVYWNLGVKVGEDNLERYGGCIVESEKYSRLSTSSGIILEILRYHDSKLNKITIRDYSNDAGNGNWIPTAVENLYEEYNIDSHLDLKREDVMGLYSKKGILLGIAKKVSD
jgi:hypothetical protein|tara:strand:- start:2014 stop:2403 length:390 start_codon:yes stop_codon:yes gene_type:complete